MIDLRLCGNPGEKIVSDNQSKRAEGRHQPLIQNIVLSLGLHSYFVTISFISVIIFKGKNELIEVR